MVLNLLVCAAAAGRRTYAVGRSSAPSHKSSSRFVHMASGKCSILLFGQRYHQPSKQQGHTAEPRSTWCPLGSPSPFLQSPSVSWCQGCSSIGGRGFLPGRSTPGLDETEPELRKGPLGAKRLWGGKQREMSISELTGWCFCANWWCSSCTDLGCYH